MRHLKIGILLLLSGQLVFDRLQFLDGAQEPYLRCIEIALLAFELNPSRIHFTTQFIELLAMLGRLRAALLVFTPQLGKLALALLQLYPSLLHRLEFGLQVGDLSVAGCELSRRDVIGLGQL